MKWTEKLSLFAIGGGAYVGLELLYRGRSHVSMFGAGGLCFLILGRLGKLELSLPVRAGIGAGAITAVEFTVGMLVNRDYRVWDYREQWGNIRGQICPAFTALWVPVSILGMGAYQAVEAGLKKSKMGN